MKVYVVGFDPINTPSGGVGGFDWRYDEDLAAKILIEHTKESGFFVWWRECEIGPRMTDGEITEHIEQMIMEFGGDGDWDVWRSDW
jgi:hypothetical protein